MSQTNPTTGRNDHVVLLTGASGSLGAHILAELLKVPSISKVYALVRASGRAEALGRIQESLKLRGLSALGPEDFSKVICLPSSLGHERLGLSPLDYEEIRAQVTAVIHVRLTTLGGGGEEARGKSAARRYALRANTRAALTLVR